MSTYEQFAEEMKGPFAGDGNELLWQELRKDRLCNSVLGQLYGNNAVKDKDLYSQRLKELVENYDRPKAEGSAQRINTFPMGKRTNDIFPYFLGVCQENRKLTPVLHAAEKYCADAASVYPFEDKTVLILTDKWDDYTFRRKFALSFTKFALKQIFLFVFILVTDYGFTRIPFLTCDRNMLQREQNWDISGSSRYEDEVKIREAYRCLLQTRFCSYSYGGGTWKQYDRGEYEFDFVKERFRRTICDAKNPMGVDSEGRIPKEAIRAIAVAVYPLRGQPEDRYFDSEKALDAGYGSAELFGKHFSWQIVRDETIQTVASALGELIEAISNSKSQ